MYFKLIKEIKNKPNSREIAAPLLAVCKIAKNRINKADPRKIDKVFLRFFIELINQAVVGCAVRFNIPA